MIDNTVQQLRKYRILGWIGLLLLTLMCVLVSLTLGARTLPISAIWHYIEMYYINMPAAHISYNDLVIDARIPPYTDWPIGWSCTGPLRCSDSGAIAQSTW